MVKVKTMSHKGLKCSLILILIVHHRKKVKMGDNAAISVAYVQASGSRMAMFILCLWHDQVDACSIQ